MGGAGSVESFICADGEARSQILHLYVAHREAAHRELEAILVGTPPLASLKSAPVTSRVGSIE